MTRFRSLGDITLTILLASCTGSVALGDNITYRSETGEVLERKDLKEVKDLKDVKDYKETEKGIVLKSGTTIKPWQVVRVDYTDLPRGTGAEGDAGRDAAENYEKYTNWYVESLNDPKTDRKVGRELKYRQAIWAAKVAELSLDKADKAAKIRDALDKLKGFSSEDNGWRVWVVSRTAARLAIETDDLEKAADILEEGSRNKTLTEEYRLELRTTSAAMQIHSRKLIPLAVPTLRKLIDETKSPELKDRIQVLLAGAEINVPEQVGPNEKPSADVNKAIEKFMDSMGKASSASQAAGHNILGEIYNHYHMDREAIQEHLWAVVVHTEDRDETILALHRVIKLYEKIGKKERADQFRERLALMNQ